MNTKNTVKNMITCIILTIIMCYNPFIMMKMNASVTYYYILVRGIFEKDIKLSRKNSSI